MTATNQTVFWLGDRYCGLLKIGSGGMGEVWAGKALGDRGFERIIAIKRLHIDRRTRESHHRAILDEAAVLQHLSASPNIVSIIDLREEDGQPALIMEYIDGPELRDVLSTLEFKNQRLPFPLVAYIVTEISKGLSSAHNCKHPNTGVPLNIVHRDISPSNIMLSSTGAVKITDFGIAKSEIQTTKTQLGEIKGKYQYMAPEQARGLEIDFRTDYFALGLVFYECLFGRPAYEASTDVEYIEKARIGHIAYPEDIPSALKRILDGLLAFHPAQRYTDLEKFRRDLGEVAIEKGGIATSDDLNQYLHELKIPQLKEAIERRLCLENTRAAPPREMVDVTGMGVVDLRWYKNRKWQIAILSAVAVTAIIAGTAYLARPPILRPSGATPAVNAQPAAPGNEQTGIISIETEPANAIVTLISGKRKFESPSPARFDNIPINEVAKVVARKDGYTDVSAQFTLTPEKPLIEHKFTFEKKPQVSVRFVSNPPSTVTVPGRLNSIESPSPVMTLPAGSYSVVFKNPLAISEAKATLDASAGGIFTCSANMQIDVTTGTPNGTSPSASCKKN